MLGAIDQAARGVQSGFERLDRAARQISANGADGDLAGAMVDVVRSTQDVRANVTVLRTVDDTIGTLLNELA